LSYLLPPLLLDDLPPVEPPLELLLPCETLICDTEGAVDLPAAPLEDGGSKL
jgi:hypothetical protein